MTADDKSTPRTLEPGEVLLDRYVVEDQVAEGGMAAVHRTHDRATGRTVALKVLYPFYSQNEVVRTRFLDEGRIQRYLDHPNIIDVYDIIERPQLSILMEFIDGPTLDEYLTDHGPLNVQELLSLILPVLSAVGFAHHKGIIHRDIKPSNILLEPTPAGMVPKIMDFGVAKVERGKDLTAAGTTVGTLHYMSPEQIVGSKDIDGRADIYSLGVTIYKLCTGEVPFNASTEFALMMAQVEARPTPPRELRPDLGEDIEGIILKALSKKPDQRYQSVKELTSALLELKQSPHRSFDDTDTDTAPLPAELLEYAMMADEVAVDRTGELDITKFQHIITTEHDQPAVDTLDATVQLDANRLKAQVLKDRASGQVSDSAPTTPLDRRETTPSNPVDSKERTQPFASSSSTPAEGASTIPADTSSEQKTLSEETTQRFRKEDVDSSDDQLRATPLSPDEPQEMPIRTASADDSTERPAPSDRSREKPTKPMPRPHENQQASADQSGEREAAQVDSQDVTQRRLSVGEPRHAPQRARASGPDSKTKRSRDDAKEQIQRIARREKGSLSRLQWMLLVGGVVLVVALVVAIAWVLFTSG